VLSHYCFWIIDCVIHCTLQLSVCLYCVPQVPASRTEFHPTIDFVWSMLSQEASAAIAGVGVYGKLKFESGIHLVQVLVTTSQI